MNNKEASELAERYVYDHLKELVSKKNYIHKTLMKNLVKNTQYCAAVLNDMCQAASEKTGGICSELKVHDTQNRSVPRIATSRDLKVLALNYQRFGGMDIIALSLGIKDGDIKLLSEAIEVKADRKCRFLHFDQPKPVVPNGVIGFELWDNVWDGDSEREIKKPLSEWEPGWLFGYLYPKEKTQKNIEKYALREHEKHEHKIPATYCTPSVLVYVLTDENTETGEILPYAVLTFEDVGSLLDLLKRKAGGKLWPRWTIDPVVVGEKQLYQNEIHDNMLYVPLEELLEHVNGVTITITREIPAEDRVHQWAVQKEGNERYWDQKKTFYLARKAFLLDKQTIRGISEEKKEGHAFETMPSSTTSPYPDPTKTPEEQWEEMCRMIEKAKTNAQSEVDPEYPFVSWPYYFG